MGAKKKFSPLFAPYLLFIQPFLLKFVLNTNGNILTIQSNTESISVHITIIVVTITRKTYFSNKAEIIILEFNL